MLFTINPYILIAGVLTIILSIIHSILGEHLIFSKKREQNKLVPSKANHSSEERHLRIIWATWHLSSCFGPCIGILLIKASSISTTNPLLVLLIQLAIPTMFITSLIVLVGTKGKHPGWFVLFLIGVFLVLGYRYLP